MPLSSHSAGNDYKEKSKLRESPVSDDWIVRVPWDIMIPEDAFLSEMVPGAQELLDELGGNRGSICSGWWVEFWFKDYDNAFHFYMVYG